MTTLTRKQMQEISKVNDLYDAEVLADAKHAIARYMASDNRPEDADDARMRCDSDLAVVGGRNPEEAARRLAIQMQDDDLWNEWAPYRPEEMTPLDADQQNREQALMRISGELGDWVSATYPEVDE